MSENLLRKIYRFTKKPSNVVNIMSSSPTPTSTAQVNTVTIHNKNETSSGSTPLSVKTLKLMSRRNSSN